MTVCQTPRYLIHDGNFRDFTRSAELGSGCTRTVYDLGDGTVLKVQRDNGPSFAGGNLTEYDAWQRVAETPDACYFAQVFGCSDSGAWLVAEYVENVGAAYGADRCTLEDIGSRYGIRDLHNGNIGTRADGSPVIIDYAFNEAVNASSDPSSDRESHGISTCCANGTLCTRHHGPQDCEDVWCNRCHGADPCTDTDCDRCHEGCEPECDVCHPADDNMTWNPHREECSKCLAFLAADAEKRFVGYWQGILIRPEHVIRGTVARWTKRELVATGARGFCHVNVGNDRGNTGKFLSLF